MSINVGTLREVPWQQRGRLESEARPSHREDTPRRRRTRPRVYYIIASCGVILCMSYPCRSVSPFTPAEHKGAPGGGHLEQTVDAQLLGVAQPARGWCTYLSLSLSLCLYIYIYIYRERDICIIVLLCIIYTYIYMYVCMYVYIYIYILYIWHEPERKAQSMDEGDNFSDETDAQRAHPDERAQFVRATRLHTP